MPKLKLASRSAGQRLAVILCLLLIPIVALLYVYTNSAFKDVRLGESQLVGVDYLVKVSKVYGQALAGKEISKAELAAISAVPSVLITNRPSLREEVQRAIDLFKSGSAAGPQHMWAMRTIVLDASSASDLALGRSRGQQLLATAYASHLPELANLLHSVSIQTQRETLSAEFSVLRDVTFHALTEAIKDDKSGTFGVALNKALSDFDSEADNFDQKIQLNMHSHAPGVVMKLIDTVDVLSTTTLDVLGREIESRTSQLRRQIALVLAGIAAVSVLAIAVATQMVKATFHKLDSVEAAEASTRAFAEDMQRLNGEIATLNQGLTQNYKMLQDTQDDNLRKSKMAQVGALTAMVAHELRNPLGSIRTSSFTVQKMARKLNLDFDKQIDRINHAVVRCDTTISQLLNYASSNTVRAEKRVIGDWLEEFLTAEAMTLPAWLEMSFDDSTYGAEVGFDPVKLGQSLSNLLLNSAQALGPLSAERTSTLKVTAALFENGVSISVADNGPGIPAEKLHLVKEPLFTTKNFGPGLGLAIADQVAKLHGGTLDVSSVPGEGTTVTVWLPLGTDSLQRAA